VRGLAVEADNDVKFATQKTTLPLDDLDLAKRPGALGSKPAAMTGSVHSGIILTSMQIQSWPTCVRMRLLSIMLLTGRLESAAQGTQQPPEQNRIIMHCYSE
jgi:hypothetical protein